jgi:hypothetical protein
MVGEHLRAWRGLAAPIQNGTHGHKDGHRRKLLSAIGVNLAEPVLQYATVLVDTRNDRGGRGGCLVSRAPKTPERTDRRRHACK